MNQIFGKLVVNFYYARKFEVGGNCDYATKSLFDVEGFDIWSWLFFFSLLFRFLAMQYIANPIKIIIKGTTTDNKTSRVNYENPFYCFN